MDLMIRLFAFQDGIRGLNACNSGVEHKADNSWTPTRVRGPVDQPSTMIGLRYSAISYRHGIWVALRASGG
jgi:hypothetical protein